MGGILQFYSKVSKGLSTRAGEKVAAWDLKAKFIYFTT